ncbi:hypothetical protein AAVH_09972, partial [Aphelenchoides avenae]
NFSEEFASVHIDAAMDALQNKMIMDEITAWAAPANTTTVHQQVRQGLVMALKRKDNDACMTYRKMTMKRAYPRGREGKMMKTMTHSTTAHQPK